MIDLNSEANSSVITFNEWMVLSKFSSKLELQILSYAFIKIKDNNQLSIANYEVFFSVGEFSDYTQRTISDYIQIKKSIENIGSLVAEFDIKLIKTCEYNTLTKKCNISFSENAVFFLESKKQRLVSHRILRESLFLKTSLTIRLYVFLIKWRYEKSTSYIKITRLKYHLNVDDQSYIRFERFRTCVIEKAVAEINHYTSLKLSYKLKTKGVGGKVQAIKFYFK